MLFLLFLLHHSYVFGQAFSDQADFAHIADQSGLPGLLSNTLKLPSSAWGVSAAAKAFSSFANAIVIIDNKHQELCCKSVKLRIMTLLWLLTILILTHQLNTLSLHLTLSQTEIDGKHKPKKVKVTPSVANYKSGSKTALLLLGQVDATLEAISLTNSNEPVPHKDLKKQCEAVELAAQQQLHLLDLSLQTYKLITAHLTCLNKVLASPDIDLAGLLLDALNVSFESTPKESNIELTTSHITEPKSSLELLLTPAL
ncbi:hypothetical protein J132_05190 [Termitomyces sp. J132]|nr:hypothetical protein J132_05190 [Termitomyces sp. J132]